MRDFNARAAPQVRPVATKAELIERLRQREKPKIEHVLKPMGSTRMTVKANHMMHNESRIRDLRERLGTARNTLRQGFAGTGAGAKLKRDMDRGY